MRKRGIYFFCAILLRNRFMSAMKATTVQLKQTKSDGLGGQVQKVGGIVYYLIILAASLFIK